MTVDGLSNNKLDKTGGQSTNLTESSKLIVGTNDNKIEITPSEIKKFTNSTTASKSILFQGDVTMTDNGDNTYSFNDGNNQSFTINIPKDMVVQSGSVQILKKENGKVAEDGTYIVLVLNDENATEIYIKATDLVDTYTVDTSVSGPIKLSMTDNMIKAELTSHGITGEYLSSDLTITNLTANTITGGGNEQSIVINKATIDKDGNYSGQANTATSLTTGKNAIIEGDISGTISNIGTASSSGTLVLKDTTNTSSQNKANVTVANTLDGTADERKIIPISITANAKGLVTEISTGSAISIGALNKVKQTVDNAVAEYPLLFANSENPSSGNDDVVKYNSSIKVNPSTSTITASNFNGTATNAKALSDGIEVSATGAISADAATWSDGKISLTTKGPGKIDNAAPTTATANTAKGSNTTVTNKNDAITLKIPAISMNTEGMVSNISETSIGLILNQVNQTKDDTTATALPILIADSATGGIAATKYASDVTIIPKDGIITANKFVGPLQGNADSATQFSTQGTIELTGAITGKVSGQHDWTINTTSTDKLIVASAANAVEKQAVTTGPAYINLIQNNAGTTASTSQVGLKGGNRVTITADVNNVITIESKDFTNDISLAAEGAKTSAISTAAADATSKADTAQATAISMAATDAQAKANAAQAAAISTAATDATGKAAAAAKTVYNTYTAAGPIDTQYPILGGAKAESGNTEAVSYSGATISAAGYVRGNKVYGAVWNDYAEYRQTHHKVRPGQCVYEKGNGSLAISYERMMPGANIVSDTFGFAIGETDECKTPLAVSGRVLAYPYESKETYNPGDAVCSGPNGTISKMTRAEIRDYPERIVGTVSEIPTYEVWGSGNIKVNGRIWIKVR